MLLNKLFVKITGPIHTQFSSKTVRINLTIFIYYNETVSSQSWPLKHAFHNFFLPFQYLLQIYAYFLMWDAYLILYLNNFESE